MIPDKIVFCTGKDLYKCTDMGTLVQLVALEVSLTGIGAMEWQWLHRFFPSMTASVMQGQNTADSAY